MTTKTTHDRKVASAYAKFRSSRRFFALLGVVVLFWVGWNLVPGLPHFDSAEFGRLNLLLSMEASVTVGLVLLDGARQFADLMRELRYLHERLASVSTASHLGAQAGGKPSDHESPTNHAFGHTATRRVRN
jgi:hypothetical protein